MAELEVWNCPRCGHVLAKLKLTPGSVVQVRCKRCNTFSEKEMVEERIATYR